MADHRISFLDSLHSDITLPEGAALAENLTIQNSPVLFGCRTGICGTCVVELDETSLTKVKPADDDEKEILEVYAPDNLRARLACQLQLIGDIKLRYLGGNG